MTPKEKISSTLSPTESPSDSSRDFSNDLSSITFILKHFRPYLSSSPDVPFSCERYFIEKKSLIDYHQQISQLGISNGLKVPKLIHFDDLRHILLIEDCGEQLSSLFDYLISIKDFPFEQTKPSLDFILKTLASIQLSLRLMTQSESFSASSYSSEGTNCMLDGYVYGDYATRATNVPFLSRYISLVETERIKIQQRNRTVSFSKIVT